MKAWKPLLTRLAIYLALLYVLVPAAIKYRGIHPQISINELYAPIVFLGVIAAFILLKREELKTYKYTFSWKQALIFGLLGYSAFAAYLIQQNMWFGYNYNVQALLLGWTLYVTGSLFLFVAVFNTKFVKDFLKPIMLTITLMAVYTGGSILLNLSGYGLGRQLTKILAPLLGLTNTVYVEYEPGPAPLVVVDDFRAIIGPPCTGITSLILFTGLFLFVVLLDWTKINKKALLWIYPLGATGMFIIAFLRVYILFLIGANWSPKFALSAFHTNAGWVLFVSYFLIYFWYMYPKMQYGKL